MDSWKLWNWQHCYWKGSINCTWILFQSNWDSAWLQTDIKLKRPALPAALGIAHNIKKTARNWRALEFQIFPNVIVMMCYMCCIAGAENESLDFSEQWKKTLKNWISLVSAHKSAPQRYIRVSAAQQRCCGCCRVRIAEGLLFISCIGRNCRKILEFLMQKYGLLAPLAGALSNPWLSLDLLNDLAINIVIVQSSEQRHLATVLGPT